MRNVRVLHDCCAQLPGVSDGYAVAAVAVDALNDALFLWCQRPQPFGARLLAFDSQLTQVSSLQVSPGALLQSANDSVCAFVSMFDDMQLFVASRQGQLCHINGMLTKPDNVGCVTAGISACSWSPDLTSLALCSPESLMLMNREFDIVCETELHTSEHGEDQLVTVGWGKKETQFQGSAGKQAALIKPEERTKVFDWDDRQTRIVWRGDGQFFATSSVQPDAQVELVRVIRVWTSDGVLSSTLRPVIGIEHSICWRPSGNWLCVSAHRADEHQMVLFERNGEIRHNFSLRKAINAETVRHMTWNTDSSILAIAFESLASQTHTVELWTVSNYHWYRKQQLRLPDRVVHCEWDVERENMLHVACANGVYHRLHCHLGTHTAPAATANRDALAHVPVVDGASLKLTPMGRCVVPPPMALHELQLPGQVNHIVWHSANTALLLVLADNSTVEVSLPFSEAAERKQRRLPADCSTAYMFVCTEDGFLLAFTSKSTTHTQMLRLRPTDSGEYETVGKFAIEDGWSMVVVHAVTVAKTLYLHTSEDDLPASDGTTDLPLDLRCGIKSVCLDVDVISYEDQLYFIGLTASHQLFVNRTKISTNANSFVVHDSHLLVSTLSHQLYCIPLDRLAQIQDLTALSGRPLEIGSRLVCAVPDDTRVIMQMRRGNLECVSPRPLLLRLLARLIQSEKYADAFTTMKKHRINLNLLHDYDPEKLLANIGVFIDQLNDPNLLNLFLLELSAEDVCRTMYKEIIHPASTSSDEPSPKNVDLILGRVREYIDSLEPDRAAAYVSSVQYTLLRQTQPDMDECCRRLAKLNRDRERYAEQIEDAVRHLLYAHDADTLFNRALATHDFDLVLLVAERSHKDPKEYLPFLNELRRLPAAYMALRIECHLERPKHAVQYMCNVQDEYWPECVQLISKHNLYTQCLQQFPSTSDRYKEVCVLYAKQLTAQRKPAEASVLFERAGRFADALSAAEQGCDWLRWARLANQHPELLDAAQRSLAVERMGQKLCLNGQQTRAAHLYRHEGKLLQKSSQALSCFCEAGQWTEAMAVAADNDSDTTALSDRVQARCDELVALCARVQRQLAGHCDRLLLLRNNKHDTLHTWIQSGEPAWLAEADLYSQASSTISQVSVSTNKTAVRRQRKRDAAKRKASTKRGSKWEDLALLHDAHMLVKLFNETQAEASSMVDCLLSLALDRPAHALHAQLHSTLTAVEILAGKIWPTVWLPWHLTGPLEQLYLDENDQVQLPSDMQSAMPGRVTFEPAMERPQLNVEKLWCKRLLHTE